MCMMNEFAVSRQYLRRPNPLAFGEVGRDYEILVYVASRLYQEALSDINHQVGGAKLPSFDELGRSGQVPGITFRGTSVHPGPNGVDLLIRQPRIICEVAVPGSANQGGILRESTAPRIALAQ